MERREPVGSALPLSEQNPESEVAEVSLRSVQQGVDQPFRFIHAFLRLGRPEDDLRIVVGAPPLRLELRETTRKFPNHRGIYGEQPLVPAPLSGSVVEQRPIDVLPRSGSERLAAAGREPIGAHPGEAVEHGVVRRTYGAAEMGVVGTAPAGVQQCASRGDEVRGAQPVRTGTGGLRHSGTPA